MPRVKRKASTFPPEFAALLQHVLDTGEAIVINNLGSNRSDYTSLRARVHEWRRAFREEAIASGDKVRIARADQFYAVTLRDPKPNGKGQWEMVVEIKETSAANAIASVLKSVEKLTPQVNFTTNDPEDTNSDTPDAGAKTIEELFSKPKP